MPSPKQDDVKSEDTLVPRAAASVSLLTLRLYSAKSSSCNNLFELLIRFVKRVNETTSINEGAFLIIWHALRHLYGHNASVVEVSCRDSFRSGRNLHSSWALTVKGDSAFLACSCAQDAHAPL